MKKTLYKIACRAALFLMCASAWGLFSQEICAQEVEFLPLEVASPEDSEVEILKADQANIAEIEKTAEQSKDAEENKPIELVTEGADPKPAEAADAGTESGEAAPLANVQEYWELCEISESYRASFTDDTDWTEANEMLYIQFKLNQLPLEMLEAWCRPQNELPQIDAWTHDELTKNRFEAFRVDGTLLSVKTLTVPEEVSARYQLKSYYECTLRLEDGREVVVFCRTVPRKFQGGQVGQNEKVGADAILLKRGTVPAVVPSTTTSTADAPATETASTTETPANEANAVPASTTPEAAPTAPSVSTESPAGTPADTSAEPTAPTAETGAAPSPEAAEAKPLPTLYLFSERLSWYPTDKTLCSFGFDCGLFDDLDRTEQGEDATRSKGSDLRLTQRNRECFYQMMHKVGRIQPQDWKKLLQDLHQNTPKERLEKDTQNSSALPLFKKPIGERGNLFHLRGTARQIVPIEVQDEDIIKRFGITRYYEIFMYTQEAPQAPIAVLVRKLPKDIKPGDAPGYRVDLEVPAFFFNTWGYHSMDRNGKPVIRLMPLLMGGTPQTVVLTKPISLFWFHVIATVVFASFGLLLLVSYITFTRNDRKFWSQGTIGRQLRPDNPGLESANLQDLEQPEEETDFTKWNDADFSVENLLPIDREIPGVIRTKPADGDAQNANGEATDKVEGTSASEPTKPQVAKTSGKAGKNKKH